MLNEWCLNSFWIYEMRKSKFGHLVSDIVRLFFNEYKKYFIDLVDLKISYRLDLIKTCLA